MLSFKKYFKLINESPTMIKYGSKIFDMGDSIITFITSEDDFYAFQTISSKLPKLLHINDELNIVDTPPVSDGKTEMYHEEMGAIFGLDLGIQTEGMYVRGRLWTDPVENSRVLVSLWAYKDEFKPFTRIFEAAVKKIYPKASEFSYEYSYFSQQGIDFAKSKTTSTSSPTETDKLKKQRAELIAQWHVTPSGPARNIIKVKIQDLNKKLGVKEDPFEAMKATRTQKAPSWLNRVGD
jgi:hypothetical protein